MKRKTTKEILVESFIELSKKKEVNRITIEDIVNNCQLSPATFYRYFKDKYDLIAWEYARNFDERFHAVDGQKYTWRDYVLETVRYSWENRIYLQNLLNNTKGYQSYIKHVTECTLAMYRDHFIRKFGENSMDGDMEIYLRHSVYGSVHLACAWVVGEFEATPEHLTELICNCVIDPLKVFMK
ncbi:MAG: TetR/AcrR family transcriptional regulator C-terminal domain-containing protein [Lachnospiraceae bacterium]|nr:TetR/AcrR family transcriptional regulator C-terminal domain-containing protein [Lachnospiraceae bacterium]